MFNPNSLFNNPLWQNGPRPGSFYDFPGKSMPEEYTSSTPSDARQNSSGPITTGTSVVGLKFADGVIIAADTLVSYGSLSRFRDIDRVFKVNDHTIIGIGGDYADFQFIKRYIDQKVTEDFCYDDNIQLKPKSLYNWLIRVLYNKRSRFNPLWIDIIVGGMQDGEPFLGHVDMRGRAYEDNFIATAYGKHIAIPFIRGEVEKLGQMPSKDQAVELTKKSMEVLYYRDCRSYSQYTYAICTATDAAKVEGPLNVSQTWDPAVREGKETLIVE